MITTATNAAGSSPQKSDFKSKKYKTEWRHEVANIKCPECGCAMVLRPSKHGLFNGCVRFPFCCGTVPHGRNAVKPYDSYTQLLLDAHKHAVNYLSKPKMLGKVGGVAWFLKHPLRLTDNDVLMATIDAASVEASKLGPKIDFIQEAHDARMRRVGTEWRDKYPQRVLRSKPKLVFTRRWDRSLLEQIEIDLEPTVNDEWADNFVE